MFSKWQFLITRHEQTLGITTEIEIQSNHLQEQEYLKNKTAYDGLFLSTNQAYRIPKN
jgi:hypothetical protein